MSTDTEHQIPDTQRLAERSHSYTLQSKRPGSTIVARRDVTGWNPEQNARETITAGTICELLWTSNAGFNGIVIAVETIGHKIFHLPGGAFDA